MNPKYVRYQSSLPNARGSYPGIFALANGLASTGRLSASDWASWRRANNDYDSAYADPSTVDETIYDRAVNPTAQSWFKCEATHLLDGVAFYTDLLLRYNVGWHVIYSDAPGKILYEDDVQIVVVPH
ncbi:hypothetical protein [Arthrobacter sp. UYEF20]|uniref:hypothetical protein n=1 Tax=Arthrobacter sp. UYEF20 TaxID=1756363 RepID=UPI0033958D81